MGPWPKLLPRLREVRRMGRTSLAEPLGHPTGREATLNMLDQATTTHGHLMHTQVGVVCPHRSPGGHRVIRVVLIRVQRETTVIVLQEWKAIIGSRCINWG